MTSTDKMSASEAVETLRLASRRTYLTSKERIAIGRALRSAEAKLAAEMFGG